MMINNLKQELQNGANKKKAEILQRFFKTGKGEYGEGDLFLGITVPEQRKVASKYTYLKLSDLEKLINSKIHEERLVSLLILLLKFKKADLIEQKKIYDFYIKNRRNINNWDLVDLSAPEIVGAFLEDKSKSLLYKFAKSNNIWERRIAIIATFRYIKKGKYEDAIKISEILKKDPHDLIRKAVGWMLREVGKNCGQKIEEEFLKKNYETMPRIMLRYAIERFPEKNRRFYFKK